MSITILNYTGCNIDVKISTDGTGSSDWFTIYQIDKWTRNPGTYTLSVAFNKDFLNAASYLVTSPSVLAISQYAELFDNQTGLRIYPIDTSTYTLNSNFLEGISINNMSGADIYVRISTKDSGSQEFFVIARGIQDIWQRNSGYTYIIQFGYFPYEESCTLAYVTPGNVYNIYSNTCLSLENGTPVGLFQGLFTYGYQNKNDDLHGYGKNEQNIRIDISGVSLNDQFTINIYNNTQYAIHVRVKSKGSGSEEFYMIGPNLVDRWSRDRDSYLTEIVTNDGESYRYYLACGYYCFANNCLFDNYNNLVQFTYDVFSAGSYYNNNQIDFTKDDIKEHFRNFFDPSKITIFNQNTKPLRVRIKSNGTSGSEDFYTIGSNCHDAWSRGYEFYLTEVTYNNSNIKFYLKRGFYYFVQDKIYDSEGNEIICSSDEFKNNINPNDYPTDNNHGDKIIISNEYGKDVLVKFSVHELGSARWYKISANKTDAWMCEHREYGLCLSFDCNESSFTKYAVIAPISLVIDQDSNIRDTNSGLIIKKKASEGINNFTIPNNLPANPNGITIINHTYSTILIRISSLGDGSEDFYPIEPGNFDTWTRQHLKYFYQMQYTLNESNMNGAISLVSVGNYYIITEDYLVTYIDGTPAPLSYDRFNNYNSNIIIPNPTPSQDINTSNNMKYISSKDRIIIYNESGREVKVRVKSSGIGSEDLYPIPADNYDGWSRISGSYLTEIVTPDGYNFRFYLNSSKTYSFKPDNRLIETESNNEIKLSKDSFDHKDQKNIVIVKHNNICIENLSNEKITIQIKTKATGSEDYFDLQAGGKYTWTRDEGTYLIEIKIKSGKTFRYYITTSNLYRYLGDNKLVDTNTQKEIPQTQDKFIPEAIKEDLSYFENKPPTYIVGTPFIDNHFPPKPRIINSLDENGNIKQSHFKSEEESDLDTYGIVFNRASEIFKSNYFLFKDNIEVDDVTQGGVGDCWLIGAIAALCVRPDLIQNIFKTKSANKDGYYEIYYYEKGQKKLMYVDDYFPGISYYKKDFRFKFAKPNGEELWVILLEKAFAKYEGGYSNINGGLINNAFTFFTGGVCKYIHNLKTSWDEIYSAIRRGNILAAGSKSGRDTEFSHYNIAQGHAYSILDAKEYNDYKNNVRLIKLRNPWGEKEWKGDYSDKSPMWTSELIEFFGAKEAFGENGIFFMKYEDFYREFSYAVVCCV